MRFKIKNKNTILLILLVASTIFMGIGYSAINSVTGEIDATATAEVQSGVFITDVELESQVDADINTSKINNYIGTTMNSTIVLSPINPSSEIVYKVTVYNNGDKNETYLGAIYDEEFYDNLGIIFEVEGINLDDEIAPKETKEFTIKFKYKDGVTPDSNILNSYINFKFGDPNRLMFADYQAETYLNSGIARDKIEDIKFVYGEVPNTGVISFFDASEKQNESIWGYYTDVDGNGIYELTFTSTGTIYANINSQDLFYDLYKVKKITFDNFSTKGTESMSYMFSASNDHVEEGMAFEAIEGLEKFDTSQVRDMSFMFYGCGNLTEINVSSFNTSKVTSMLCMFDSCYSLPKIDLSNFDTSQVTDMAGMFEFCYELKDLNLSNFNTSKVTNMEYMFFCCYSLPSIDLSNFDTSQVTTMEDMFGSCENITNLDISKFDTSNVTNMSGMFEWCLSLNNLDVRKFNTSKVTNMRYMFFCCTGLTSLDVSSFDTSNVTNMESMFSGVSDEEHKYYMKLKTIIGLENFNTSKVTNMNNMFWNCIELESIDVSSFDTSNVTDMSGMFACYMNNMKLKEIKGLENFDTSNVLYMFAMFQNGIELTSLDLSSFNTAKLTNTEDMFCDCEKLKTIYVSEYNEETNTGWTMKSIVYSDYMFENCQSIVGQMGTTYDPAHQDKEYGRIDKFGEPGYLTNKNLVENRLKYYNYTNESTFMSSGVEKNKIEDVKFIYGEVPNSGVISQFDASEKQDNSIIGYYTDTDNNGLYELTFVSKEKIYANKDSSRLFMDFTEVKNINFDNFTTKGTTNILAMFSNCYKLTKLDVSKFDTSEVTLVEGLFGSANDDIQMNLQEIIGLENWNTSKVTSMSGMFMNCRNLTSIDVSNFDTSQVLDMTWMFYGCSSLTELNVKNFNTSKVKSMKSMFYECRSLTNIDVSNFDTSQVIDMSFMFYGCSSLTELNVSDFDTSQVTNMIDMFGSCSNLTNLNLSNFNTSQVTSMAGMFEMCLSIENIDVSQFNTSQVTDMSFMFSGCSALKELNVSQFNTSRVTNMMLMFDNCAKLTNLNLCNFNTSQVTSMAGMFEMCMSIENIDVSNFDTSQVTDMSFMFNQCTGLTNIDISNFNTSKVTNMNFIFGNNPSLKTIYVSEYDEATDTGWTTKSVSNSTNMFQNCTSLVGGNGTKFDSSHTDKEYGRIDKYGEPGYLTNKTKNRLKISNQNDTTYLGTECPKNLIEKIEFIYGEVPNSGVVLKFDASEEQNGSIMGYYTDTDNNGLYELTFCSKEAIYTNINSSFLFSNLTNLKELKLDNFYTKGTTNMSCMFHNCTSLVELNLGDNFITDNVTDMTCMFGAENNTSGIKLNKIVGLEKFNTSNVTIMDAMFWNNRNITELNLTNFNTSNVTSMVGMFSGCYELVDLNISSFDTSNVTDMRTMFDWCESLVNLDLSNFNTSRVTNMDGMFDTCTNLKTINLSSFDTSNVTNMSNMFKDCKSITTLNLNNIKTNSVTDMTSMFYNCTHLTSLDLSSFDTNNVTSMNSMFLGCTQLKEIKFGSNFNTKNVTDMFMMFQRCGINTLDLSTFNTSKVNDMRYMFYNCSTLTTIYVSEYNETTDTGWTTKSVTNSTNMFNFCRDLVGGIGTTYNSSILDATYARIDKAGEPGYFTNITDKQ